MWTLGGFNTADPEAATRILTACCASRAWAEKLATGRPYGSLAALKSAALAGFDELAVAHAAHPPIGGLKQERGKGPAAGRGGSPVNGRNRGPRSGAGANSHGRSPRHADGANTGSGARPADRTEAEWSRGEQSRAMTADASVRAELTAANAAYERRFGRVFLICATGLTAEEILAEARRRLGNDDPAERAESRAELRKIVALRLDKAFGNASASASGGVSGEAR
jgi:2-oxo-4-hydroxy-4-carboxy-5-ureidoimidazoline decarboxylase